LVQHDLLVLSGEVVLDDPAVEAVVDRALPEATERALRLQVVVVPHAGDVLLDRHAHARVEVPRELRAEHAGQVVAAAPPRRVGRRDVGPRALSERPGQPRPEAAIVGLRPLPAAGVEVLAWALAEVVALGDVAAEAVADEDRVLALGPARDEPRAQH